ncbi:hypothetical protein F5X96DRAFT_666903 [Biscogniauxia mediterranea]|nr:hypothetical protein F5X96DRAFT_666903 [Biscogniauxia mediterranea]
MRRCTCAAVVRNCSTTNAHYQRARPCLSRQYTTTRTQGHDDGAGNSTTQNGDGALNTGPDQEALPPNKDGVETTPVESQKQSASDAATSFGIDQTEKTVKTARGRKLPLSPVMDPSYWEAKQRHQKKKAEPGRPRGEMERMVSRNPFAKALATSIRQCTATRVRLPKFFLQEFGLLSHPETEKPWWVPRSLAPTQPPPHLAQKEHDNSDKLGVEEHSPSRDEGISPPAKQPDKGDRLVYAPSAHILARKDLLSSFNVKKSGFENHQKKLYGPLSSPYKDLQRKAVWREDMADFMLGLMRDDICGFIRHLAKLSFYMGPKRITERHIVPFTNWDTLRVSIQGAVLWFGENEEAVDSNGPREPPGPFATYDVKTGAIQETILVHNMPLLLGSELAEKVRTESEGMKDHTMFYLAGVDTTRLQSKLWRLQEFLFSGYEKDAPQPPGKHAGTAK